MKDDLPSINFLYCALWLLTHAPSLKKCSKDSRYQNVERKRGDADIPHLLWIVIVYSWDITIAIGHLIFHQLRQSKVKSILIKIPDKADVVQTVDSILSYVGWFAFYELLVLPPLFADPTTKPKEMLNRFTVIKISRASQGDADILHLLWVVLVSPRNITISIGLLIFHKLRQSKVKCISQRIPDKADVIENIDSILSNEGWFAFHEPFVLPPLSADPFTKPKRNIE